MPHLDPLDDLVYLFYLFRLLGIQFFCFHFLLFEALLKNFAHQFEHFATNIIVNVFWSEKCLRNSVKSLFGPLLHLVKEESAQILVMLQQELFVEYWKAEALNLRELSLVIGFKQSLLLI